MELIFHPALTFFILRSAFCIIVVIEIYTNALVLKKETAGEVDGMVTLYTQKMGKVLVKARGLKKILSKSGHHLEPLNFAKVRLVESKSGFLQLIDALSCNKEATFRVKRNPERLVFCAKMCDFIDKMTYELQEDYALWQFFENLYMSNASENEIYKEALKALGFDPDHAQCKICRKEKNLRFLIDDHIFLCRECSR